MARILPPAGCKVYTPSPIADAVIGQLLNEESHDWLEPSVGRGAFVDALANRGVARNHITAVDLDRSPGPADSKASIVRGVDFLSWALTQRRRFDRIVANPPYVAIPKLTPELKGTAVAALTRLTSTPNGGANYWVPFLATSMDLLRIGGSLGFILPASWDYADYAAPIRDAVLRNFSTVIVHRCRKPLFPSVQEGVVILLAKGYGGQSSKAVRCDHSDDVALLAALQGVADHSSVTPSSFRDSDVVESITTFGDLFDIKLGGVTGDSRYFLLTEDRRRELGLPERTCTPVISKASHLQTPVIYRTDWTRMKDEGKRAWLFSPSPGDRHLKSVARYLRLRKDKGGCDRKAFKVSNRDPWYTVPLPERIDGFLSGMTRHGPWISWRAMRNLTATNTLYVLSCKERLTRAEKFAWSISLLTSTARSAADRLGRRYADGLTKYEPGDLKQIPLPSPLSTRNSSENYQSIIQLLLAGKERTAEARADALCSKGEDPR